MSSVSAEFLNQSQAALEQVGREFRSQLLAASGTIAHEVKSDNTPVTELDRTIELAIKDALRPLDPAVGFRGEEHGQEGSDETFWLIDPIDGTEQFIRGIPAFRMMATLIADERPQFAWVYHVPKNEHYTARHGEGAFCNGQALQISQRPLRHALIEFTSNLALPEAVALIPPIRQASRGVRMTSDFTHTPQGRLDGHLYYKATGSAWDWTPWALLIKEAGGKVANIGKPDYDYRDGNFLAANPVIFDELKQVIDAAAAEAQP